MARKFPPRGYRSDEYPLPHNFSIMPALQAELATKGTTIVPFFRTSELAVSAETIEVNPRNANFAEDTGCIIHNGSIVPRLTVKMLVSLTKGAVETDKIRALNFYYMPLYFAFVDSLDAMDDKTATQVEDIMEMQHDVTNKDTYPLYNTTKLSAGIMPLSTVPLTEAFGDVGLTTSTTLEGVTWIKEDFHDTLSYKTNAGMLKKVTGGLRKVVVTRDRPFSYFTQNFTHPMVKRGNPYTFCGMLLHLPQVSTPDQFQFAAETTVIDHLNIQIICRFDEWNQNFDQNQY